MSAANEESKGGDFKLFLHSPHNFWYFNLKKDSFHFFRSRRNKNMRRKNEKTVGSSRACKIFVDLISLNSILYSKLSRYCYHQRS